VLYQPWNFVPGSNFVLEMNNAARSRRTIAVISEHYLASTFTQPEWASAFATDPTGTHRALVPVRVGKCDIKQTLLAQIVSIDLVGVVDETAAIRKLLGGLQGLKPDEAPCFPSSSAPVVPFPGTLVDPATRASTRRLAATNLPPAGIRIPLSPKYYPPLFRGVYVHKNDPLTLDFILDSGDAQLATDDLAEVSLRLSRYFLAALAIPDEHLWVNLSPHERDRIIPSDLAQTQMGVDLLLQDYILKQITSTLCFPETQSGAAYWNKIYAELGGADQEAVNTFNKVWVTPARATITERGAVAVVEDSMLRVQMEQDYLATVAGHAKAGVSAGPKQSKAGRHAAEVFRATLLPLIEADVNHGGNFAVLRQIFSSLILATWYKQVLHRSIVAELYINKGKTAASQRDGNCTPENIYEQYLAAYKSGVFNYIREDRVGPAEEDIIPRKYFSGGVSGTKMRDASARHVADSVILTSQSSSGSGVLFVVRVRLADDISGSTDCDEYADDTVGGIDLGAKDAFDFRVNKVGAGIQFNLDDDVIDRLRRQGMGQLQPRISLMRRVEGDQLTISSTLEPALIEVPTKARNGARQPTPKKGSGLISRLRSAWNALRGST
jgi:hypothetical protein